MKIDWKKVAKSPGYISLKASYINSRKSKHDNGEALVKFNWVICRAKHYAIQEHTTIDAILDAWERHRTYSWKNYYQDYGQPKQHPHKRNPTGLREQIRNIKSPGYSTFLSTTNEISIRIQKEIARVRRNKVKKLKPRWDMALKRSKIRQRAYLASKPGV